MLQQHYAIVSLLSVSLGSCVIAGYDSCCVSGFCAGTPPNCFCDYFCSILGDCCNDIDQICTECEYMATRYTAHLMFERV